MKNKTFGIIGAMESEIAQLRDTLTGCETTEVYGLAFYSGTLGENRVVLVKSGIGKVNAARCTQILIDRFSPDYIVNTGIAGGIGEGLAVEDVVVGTELVQHDIDAVAFGYARGNICDPAHRDTPSVFRSDETLIEAFRAAAASVIDPARIKAGRIATGDLFVASAETKRDIAATFGAVAAEMEGGAIAQVAAFAGVPFIVLRAISDLADGSSVLFADFEREIADISAAILHKLIAG